MHKADAPPAYEDALNSPRYAQQQYGYVEPPPPPPPYSPDGPGYWDQASARTGPGYPPAIIPTLSAGVLTSYPGDMEAFLGAQWHNTWIRHAFIRKVYLILAAQLSVTIAIVGTFTFVDPVRLFVINNPAIYWASFGVYVVVYCIVICFKETRRRYPWNLLLLSIFTLALSYMTGTIASYYDTKAVFLAIGITAVVCVAVTIFSFQTKVDFTSCGGLLCILSVSLMIVGIVTAVVLCFKYIPWVHMLYAAIGAIVYTLFLAYNTQLLIGNKELALSPEEYIYGALCLYTDIVQIFLFILQIGGAATE
ncbi:protein lifeguard 3-like [Centroberyx gerrardi]